jgi:hypothetical protein
MPSVVCASCNKAYRVADDAAGKKFKCKNCGGVIQVPGGAVAKPLKVLTPPPLPVRRAAAVPEGGDADLDALASLEAGGTIDNSIPFTANQAATRSTRTTTIAKSKPVKSPSKFAFGFHPSRLPILLIVFGVGLGIWGGKEAMLASSALATAQDISCADLSANGPGDNVHVRVKDFKCVSHYVYLKSTTGDWKTVWFPIVPPSAIKIPPGKHMIHANSKAVSKDLVDSSQIHVLIKTHTVHSQGDVASALNNDSFEGLVVNKIEKLSDKERELFQNSYPQMDVDNVYILEDGRQPAGGTGMLALIGGGLLLLCGLAILFRPN